TALNLPSAIGSTEMFGNMKTKLRDPSWFTAIGLIFGTTNENREFDNPSSKLFKNLKNSIKSITKQLMP
ncbi:hypothetical protein K2P96_01710, partial [Patescibacteria group bacterium]|nr:hypothetical protein [Patescibacteria group bacterium]